MKRRYDGYELGTEKSMYNPYAVMRALSRQQSLNYIGNVILVGINYDKCLKLLTCKIEKIRL